jgi:hypothetical protein
LDYYLETQIKFRILISPCSNYENKTECTEGLEETVKKKKNNKNLKIF